MAGADMPFDPLGKVWASAQASPMKALLFAAMILVLLLLRIDAPRTIRKRLEKWARSRGFPLVDVRGARWDRPRALRRYRWPHDYYITVEDSSGAIRRGWLLEDFAYMGFGGASYRAQWEDTAASDPL
jgi:hypothetical protein